ncbi:MAG: hypothetical protein RBS46_00010 [Methyloversatilis sp.]|jgi:hypothetical protein|nr:hypothetical protein [Methyloversatilis sp.]
MNLNLSRICARDPLAFGRIRLPERPISPAALAFEALIADTHVATDAASG